MKQWLLKLLGKNRPPSKQLNLPEWEKIFNSNKQLWEEAKEKASHGPRVLIATSVGGVLPLSVTESLLAVALTLRGAKVHTLLCDRVLPGCLNIDKLEINEQIVSQYKLAETKCEHCFPRGNKIFESLGLSHHLFSELIKEEEREKAKYIANTIPINEIENYQLNNWNIGEHAYAGTLRYFASGNLDNESYSEIILRRYLESSLLTAFVINNLLSQYDFQVGCFSHGIYSPHGIIGEVCRDRSVSVVNWNIAYRKCCFIFSHQDTYHHTMLSEPMEMWENIPWTKKMEQDILDYLKSRWQGSRDWIWFHEKPEEEFNKIAQQLKLDLNKPIIGMLTNVMWDAQLHYPANTFPNMLTWVIETIKYFSQRQDLQLLIRIHPAEIRGTLPSRQPLLAEINKVFPQLPDNIIIIPPESPVSTYAAMMECDSVIIYGTKTGVELTSVGIPVIVGGEAWIRGKNITIDPQTPAEYWQELDKLPLKQRLSNDIVTRARKYAYHFFFRRMIPLKCIEPTPGKPPYKINITQLEQLLPGIDPGLDTICNGILSESSFIYPGSRGEGE